jgi:hypothetical protein
MDSNQPKAEQEPIQKTTLTEFIEVNSKLITSLAAFIALTAFALQLDKAQGAVGLSDVSAAALFAAFLISFELFWNLRVRTQHWRLALFQIALLCLFVSIGRYWFSHYKEVWIGVLLSAIPIVLLLAISVALSIVARKVVVSVATRVLKRDMEPKRMERVSEIIFIAFLVLSLVGWGWLGTKVRAHTIQIKVPWVEHFK